MCSGGDIGENYGVNAAVLAVSHDPLPSSSYHPFYVIILNLLINRSLVKKCYVLQGHVLARDGF